MTVWRDRVYPYPRKLLISLGEENKQLFLSHVQTLAPQLYNEWLHYIRMEELSRLIYQILLPEPSSTEKKTLIISSEKLLTTNDEQSYVLQLFGLVHKVFKEEWVKLMLIRGNHPDKVMAKIDEYWDEREQSVKQAQEKHYGEDKYHDEDKKHDFSRRYYVERTHDSEKHRGRERRFVGEKHRYDGRRFVGEPFWREIR